MRKPLVFFIDVDNTLLDNDSVKQEIKTSLIKVLGVREAQLFWELHDAFRAKHNLVDFPAIITNYCKTNHPDSCDARLHDIFFTIDFKQALYPYTMNVLAHLKTLGSTALFTEGDAMYQARKIEQSGLKDAVDKTYLFKHKSDHVQEVLNEWKEYIPVFIDDRSTKLINIQQQYPCSRIIEVCQGHYSDVDHTPHAELDRTIDSIQDLIKLSAKNFY